MSLLLEVLAFEAGSGTLRRLAEEGIAYGAIRHWFFSHAHLDHCGDLVPLLFAKRIPALAPNGDLEVYGWDGIAGYHHWDGEIIVAEDGQRLVLGS